MQENQLLHSSIPLPISVRKPKKKKKFPKKKKTNKRRSKAQANGFVDIGLEPSFESKELDQMEC